MHYKRRKRRRGGIKGHCAMCGSRTRNAGLRNKRLPTRQEQKSLLSFAEQVLAAEERDV